MTARKPDPAGYLPALDRLGLPAQEAVAFEDTAHGVAAAQAATKPERRRITRPAPPVLAAASPPRATRPRRRITRPAPPVLAVDAAASGQRAGWLCDQAGLLLNS